MSETREGIKKYKKTGRGEGRRGKLGPSVSRAGGKEKLRNESNKRVSNLVIYTQSTITVISGRKTRGRITNKKKKKEKKKGGKKKEEENSDFQFHVQEGRKN